MKSGSDNYLASSIQGVMRRLGESGKCSLLVFEPTLGATEFNGFEVTNDFEEFKNRSDIIVANRWSEELADVEEKVYSRDLFGRD